MAAAASLRTLVEAIGGRDEFAIKWRPGAVPLFGDIVGTEYEINRSQITSWTRRGWVSIEKRGRVATYWVREEGFAAIEYDDGGMG